MNRSSKSKKQSNGSTGINTVATSSFVVAAPPATGAPRAPRGFVAQATSDKKGMRPTRSQVGDAPGAAAEVKTSATFSADFTENADQAALAQMLERAAAWRAQLTAADAWWAYVRAQDGAAWRAVLGDLEAFKLAFAYASKKDATIATRYPQLARFLGVRKEAGARGARTRALEREKNAAAAASSTKGSSNDAGATSATTNGETNAVVTNGSSGAVARA